MTAMPINFTTPPTIGDDWLSQIVQHAGRNVRTPKSLDKQSLFSAVWIEVKKAIPKLANHPNLTGAIHTTAEREWWRAVESEQPHIPTESLSLKELPSSPEQTERPDICDTAFGNGHLARATASRAKKLPSISRKELRCVKAFFHRKIIATLEAAIIAQNDDAIRIDGILHGLQESRLYCVGKYYPCETPMVKFTASRRVPKETE